jgi:hypothetical protein
LNKKAKLAQRNFQSYAPHYLTNNGSNLGDSHSSGATFVSTYNYVWVRENNSIIRLKRKHDLYREKNGCIARKLAQQKLIIPLPGTFAA